VRDGSGKLATREIVGQAAEARVVLWPHVRAVREMVDPRGGQRGPESSWRIITHKDAAQDFLRRADDYLTVGEPMLATCWVVAGFSEFNLSNLTDDQYETVHAAWRRGERLPPRVEEMVRVAVWLRGLHPWLTKAPIPAAAGRVLAARAQEAARASAKGPSGVSEGVSRITRDPRGGQQK